MATAASYILVKASGIRVSNFPDGRSVFIGVQMAKLAGKTPPCLPMNAKRIGTQLAMPKDF
jgi:hypothetical protein